MDKRLTIVQGAVAVLKNTKTPLSVNEIYQNILIRACIPSILPRQKRTNAGLTRDENDSH